MNFKAILFDLDGTLLPLDQEKFTEFYFKELIKVLTPFGFDPKVLINTIWSGTKAMVLNDGKKLNREIFWEQFVKLCPCEIEKVKPACDRFYTNEFHNVKICTAQNPFARDAVRLAHEKAEKVVLATNPLFPKEGQHTRIGWIGLTPQDFTMITSYDSDSFCKPNPDYYLSICERIDVSPSECLMIGNDENEDMYAAGLTGMSCFLVTDHLILCREHPFSGKRGSFTDMITFLDEL